MASLKDVALLSGVSPSTVSRAINSPQMVDPNTLKNIRSAMKKLNYRPNLMASGLRSKSSKQIALVVPGRSSKETAAYHLSFGKEAASFFGAEPLFYIPCPAPDASQAVKENKCYEQQKVSCLHYGRGHDAVPGRLRRRQLQLRRGLQIDPPSSLQRIWIMKNMIASQKKGNVEMGLNYHNLMEDIVLQHVDRILEADGCYCCDICKSDVITYALNHLPPQYVVTDTREIDGHDFEQMESAFDEARATKGVPFAIIMTTIKGKGVSFMEDVAGWHGKAPNDEEYKTAMDELKARLAEVEGM